MLPRGAVLKGSHLVLAQRGIGLSPIVRISDSNSEAGSGWLGELRALVRGRSNTGGSRVAEGIDPGIRH